MKRIPIAFLLATALIIAGCVLRTEHKIDAHITLDIRHIEEQAEQTLDYIEGKTDSLPGLEGSAESAPTSFLQRTLDTFSPVQVAYAAELKADSPLVKQILDSLRSRHGEVSAMKKDGCFGENNRGYVELRECAALADADKKNAAQQLLAEENKDRKALYNEIARLNKEEGVSVSTVESIYAMERLDRAATGEVVQLPAAGEQFEAIKSKPLCQKLGADCKPGAWVAVS